MEEGSEPLTSCLPRLFWGNPTANLLTCGPLACCYISCYPALSPSWAPRTVSTRPYARASCTWTPPAGSTSATTPRTWWGRCWPWAQRRGSRWRRLWTTDGSGRGRGSLPRSICTRLLMSLRNLMQDGSWKEPYWQQSAPPSGRCLTRSLWVVTATRWGRTRSRTPRWAWCWTAWTTFTAWRRPSTRTRTSSPTSWRTTSCTPCSTSTIRSAPTPTGPSGEAIWPWRGRQSVMIFLPRYPPSDACHKLKDGLTALNYLEVSDREEMSDVEEVREILSCPGVRALLQSHDVVAHEVYGEEAVRVTPPNSTVNLTVAQDDVEGPNGECPPVSEAMAG